MDKKFNNPLEADAHNWDTMELDDKKLREQITQIISEFKFGDWLEEVMEHERAAAYEVTNQILALIKQAGWNPPEDNASIYQTLANMHKWAKAAGYVQLDPDQTPPTSSMAYPSGNYQSAQQDMVRAGWRKVVLKEE